ncbi:MAG: hypothetical protein HOV79_04490 [Hamadaea sp.]|nr:hypothetical protein [Hamadaea sp.]
MHDLAEPAAYAALVAPAIDRVFAETMLAGRAMGGRELSERFGGPLATGYLVDLRTRLGAPGGVVTDAEFAAVRRYGDLAKARELLIGQAERGMVTLDDGIRATERGRAFITEVYALHAKVTAELWAGHPVERLAALAGRALAVAQDPATWAHTTDGHSLAAMAPPFEPSGTPSGVLLLNRLGTLRYHRADAHAAAWQAAGLTAAGIATMAGDAAGRTTIEEETNRGAAAPWRALTPAERLELLAGLAALPAAPRL